MRKCKFYMKKRIPLFLLFCFTFCIIILPYNVFAEITILQKPDSGYYQNDRIATSVRINSGVEQSIFSIKLVCSEKSAEYYSIPVEKGISQTNAPAFLITGAFNGNCYLAYQLRDTEEKVLETTISEEFKIVKRLNITVNIDKQTYMPGDSAKITGTTSNSDEKKMTIELLKENISIKKITTSVRDIINTAISIPEDISNQAVIMVSVNDGLKDTEKEFNVNIKSVPKTILVSTNKNEIKPEEFIEITASVFNQAGDIMEEKPRITITNPAGKIIISEESKKIRYEIRQFFIPGVYKIKAEIAGIEAEETFFVPAIKEIAISVLNNGSVSFWNIGNILYEEQAELNLSSEKKNYIITMLLSIQPNESFTVKTGDFVPLGFYNITFQNNTLYNIKTGEDERGTIKKVSQSIQKITGAGIIDADSISPAIFFLIIICFASFMTLYFTQRKMKESALNIIRNISERQQSKIAVLQENAIKYKSQNKKIREIFAQYAGLEVPDEKKIGMQSKNITVLFTDIRGFASFFDKSSEKETATILNMYFRKANEIIKNNGGFINKFVGDSVMALFNAPRQCQDHEIRAIKTALEIKSEIAILNEKLKLKGMRQIEVGIGIDSGIAAVGNLGSAEKTEYTAIGIPVNVAFRLQALGKETQILITEKVYEKVKDRIKAEGIGIYELKNISKPVKVYNVLEFFKYRQF